MNKILPIHERYPSLIAEFRDEIEAERPGWIRTRRLMYLWDRAMAVYWYLSEVYDRYGQYQTQPGWWRQTVLKLNRVTDGERKLKSLVNSYRYHLLEGEPSEWAKNRITDEQIRQAESHDIASLLDINKFGYARCLNHRPDKHPSMYCKNNFAYCFVCGWTGNAIKVYMVLNDCNFVTAVKALSN